jgi:hypothetical protein
LSDEREIFCKLFHPYEWEHIRYENHLKTLERKNAAKIKNFKECWASQCHFVVAGAEGKRTCWNDALTSTFATCAVRL